MTSPVPHRTPRLHRGGKLSFRARLEDGHRDGGDRLVLGGEDPPPLGELVPEGFRHVEVEVGPGKGAFLLAAAAARPDVFVLGIEASHGYAAHAAARLCEAGLRNGLVLFDNAKVYLQDRVPAAGLAAIHVYFPDPWPKRRHKGRRFFTDEVPAVLARALVDGGLLFVATDNAAYAGQMCRVLGASEELLRDDAAAAEALERGQAFSPTSFERKYREQGRTIRRFAFRRRPRRA